MRCRTVEGDAITKEVTLRIEPGTGDTAIDLRIDRRHGMLVEDVGKVRYEAYRLGVSHFVGFSNVEVALFVPGIAIGQGIADSDRTSTLILSHVHPLAAIDNINREAWTIAYIRVAGVRRTLIDSLEETKVSLELLQIIQSIVGIPLELVWAIRRKITAGRPAIIVVLEVRLIE